MALPKPVRPEYSTTIPSTGKRIKFQPFSVREEKVLILASESEDVDEISNALSNVLESCITTPADFSVSELALFDIEYLFLKCRAKSAGEKISIKITDPNDVDFTTVHEIDIDKIKVVKNKEHKDIVELSSGIKVKMRYPDISFFQQGINIDDIQSSMSLVSKCISQIVDGDEVYNKADMTEKEILEWLEGLTLDDFKRVIEFFNTMPKLAHSFKVKNTNRNTEFEISLNGLADFF